MKRIISILLALTLIGMPEIPVFAQETTTIEENNSKPFLALGADLTEEQQATVLNLMGLSETDLGNYDVVYITNEQEHQYLDKYIEPALIGTKSLSSVLVKQAKEGHGVVVSTKNITYCTTGMYRNALLTAGIKDADILVVGPTQISGTAGLIGAIKAYEKMSGKPISEETIDAALNELVATGQVVGESLYSDEIEELIAFIKAKIAAGELTSEEDICDAITQGQESFGVSLTEEEINRIVDFMLKINELGLDPDVLLNQAKDLYNKYGNELFKNPDKAVSEIVKSSVGSFFTKIGDSIVEFLKGLFS